MNDVSVIKIRRKKNVWFRARRYNSVIYFRSQIAFLFQQHVSKSVMWVGWRVPSACSKQDWVLFVSPSRLCVASDRQKTYPIKIRQCSLYIIHIRWGDPQQQDPPGEENQSMNCSTRTDTVDWRLPSNIWTFVFLHKSYNAPSPK